MIDDPQYREGGEVGETHYARATEKENLQTLELEACTLRELVIVQTIDSTLERKRERENHACKALHKYMQDRSNQ